MSGERHVHNYIAKRVVVTYMNEGGRRYEVTNTFLECAAPGPCNQRDDMQVTRRDVGPAE